MEVTPNYELKKPGDDDFYDVKDFNDNADIIDQALKAHDDALQKVSRGIANFAGGGNEVTIPHGLSVTPVAAYAFPTVNPQGYLGEAWIRMDATNIYVGNSGSFNGQMCWVAIG